MISNKLVWITVNFETNYTPNFRKVRCRLVDLINKFKFEPYVFFLQIEPMILIPLMTSFDMKLSDFKIIKLLIRYTRSCMKSQQKTVITRNAIIPNSFNLFRYVIKKKVPCYVKFLKLIISIFWEMNNQEARWQGLAGQVQRQ